MLLELILFSSHRLLLPSTPSHTIHALPCEQKNEIPDNQFPRLRTFQERKALWRSWTKCEERNGITGNPGLERREFYWSPAVVPFHESAEVFLLEPSEGYVHHNRHKLLLVHHDDHTDDPCKNKINNNNFKITFFRNRY